MVKQRDSFHDGGTSKIKNKHLSNLLGRSGKREGENVMSFREQRNHNTQTEISRKSQCRT
jgi:hypothetical protein